MYREKWGKGSLSLFTVEKAFMPPGSSSEPNRLYLRPHPLLAPYIAHYTLTYPENGPQPPGSDLALIPDASGCIVFSLGQWELSAAFWGPTTKTVFVKYDYNEAPIRFFVEFRPGGAQSFLGACQGEYRDQRLPLSWVSPSLWAGLREALERAQTIPDLVARANACLLRHLKGGEGQKVLSLLPSLSQGGVNSVEELAMAAGYSKRHLSRLFHEVLGVGAKGYSRLVRINRALAHIKAGAPSFTDLAQELGYYDQAHFDHDFKAVCGVSPSDYRRQMAFFYNEARKFSGTL